MEDRDSYLKSDVLLLADDFENFRKMCKDQYGLDCYHYYSTPGLSWDALLKMIEIKLELLQDIDMHLFIEEGLRGGISVIRGGQGKAGRWGKKDVFILLNRHTSGFPQRVG